MVFPLLVCLLPFGLAQVTVWPYGNFGQPSFAPWGQFGQGQASTRGPFDQIGQGRPQPPFNPFVSSFTLPPQGPAGTLPPFGPFTTGGRGPPPGLPQATTPAPPTGTPFLINSGAGQIQGLVVTDSKSGGRYGVFLGIPYAQPPVGNLRFQDPRPLTPTSQVVRATAYGKNCASVPFDANTQSEDCLFLNILTPKNSQQVGTNLPVMFWIHGGALQLGSGNFDSVNNLLSNIVSKGVVLVTINYRLGPWGFWTSRSQVAPGNMGFMDQLMALQWVRSNIAAFGGDPQQITLFGESAGGQSVTAQTLSPLSNTLFKRAIIMSGPLFAVGEIFLDTWKSDPNMELAQAVGCWNNGSGIAPDMVWRNALNCLQNVPVSRISDAEASKPSMPYQRYGLRVDGKFFPRSLEELARSRPRMDVMIGTTKDEYLSLAELQAMMGGQPIVKTPEDITSVSIPNFITNEVYTSGDLVRKAAQYQYVELAKPNAARQPTNVASYWLNQDVKMKSAMFFWVPTFIDARYLVQSGSNVYLYSWDYVNDKPTLPGQQKGAGHGSELDIIFDQPSRFGPAAPDSARDTGMKQLSSNIWTNFAKTGRPGLTWTPLNLRDWNYFSLDYPTQQMRNDYHLDDAMFWTVLVPSLQSAGAGADVACTRAKQAPNMPMYWYTSTYCQ